MVDEMDFSSMSTEDLKALIANLNIISVQITVVITKIQDVLSSRD